MPYLFASGNDKDVCYIAWFMCLWFFPAPHNTLHHCASRVGGSPGALGCAPLRCMLRRWALDFDKNKSFHDERSSALGARHSCCRVRFVFPYNLACLHFRCRRDEGSSRCGGPRSPHWVLTLPISFRTTLILVNHVSVSPSCFCFANSGLT